MKKIFTLMFLLKNNIEKTYDVSKKLPEAYKIINLSPYETSSTTFQTWKYGAKVDTRVDYLQSGFDALTFTQEHEPLRAHLHL